MLEHPPSSAAFILLLLIVLGGKMGMNFGRDVPKGTVPLHPDLKWGPGAVLSIPVPLVPLPR